jgi:hypothetical protein
MLINPFTGNFGVSACLVTEADADFISVSAILDYTDLGNFEGYPEYGEFYPEDWKNIAGYWTKDGTYVNCKEDGKLTMMVSFDNKYLGKLYEYYFQTGEGVFL